MERKECDDELVEIEGKKVMYVDSLSDWGFKRLFGTEVNKEILLYFLRGLFPEKEIADIFYLNTENQGETGQDRRSVFDVVCMTTEKERFIVEMQKKPQAYFRDRSLYYSTFAIQRQAPAGDWNYRLTPVYSVGILNFGLEHPHGENWQSMWGDRLIHRYRLQETETGEVMTENLNFVFLEVGKFLKSEDELETDMDRWMYALKNMSGLTERPAALQARIFTRLFEAAKVAAFTRSELDEYREAMMTENDQKNAIDYARQQGLAEGEANGRAEIIRKMLESGMDRETVMKITGISPDNIPDLQSGIQNP